VQSKDSVTNKDDIIEDICFLWTRETQQVLCSFKVVWCFDQLYKEYPFCVMCLGVDNAVGALVNWLIK
jgi:hypothetical protein